MTAAQDAERYFTPRFNQITQSFNKLSPSPASGTGLQRLLRGIFFGTANSDVKNAANKFIDNLDSFVIHELLMTNDVIGDNSANRLHMRSLAYGVDNATSALHACTRMLEDASRIANPDDPSRISDMYKSAWAGRFAAVFDAHINL